MGIYHMDIRNIFNASVLSMLHLMHIYKYYISAPVEATEFWKWKFECRGMTNKVLKE